MITPEDMAVVRAVVREEMAKFSAPPQPTPKALRKKAGLTQEELATLAGVGPSSVSRIERGMTKHATAEVLRKIGAALNYPKFAEIVCR